jgi:hypothetical protein
VRVGRLPLVAELGHCPLLVLRDEDRVEAEALRAARFVHDAALEDAGAAVLLAVRRERDELADIARPPVLPFDADELAKEPLDVLVACESRRVDTRGAA